MLTNASRGSARGRKVTDLDDTGTSGIQRIAADPATRRGAVIDPVLDHGEATATASADALPDVVRERGW